ncbi:transcription initiation factor tfiid subunit 13 [Neofusicoccum parvum]|uniref:Transcription initiation factor TFIID subunit 13 n=2 Tax=Neofusicoccum TaxID=407951 RepID=R1GIW6_BOTPV|nr:putative transcription initiation factor tfiid subunit 13 protein [Neofusicoccum parvum UCRNP2]GME34754.1 transcription initiation factor tfiid subunit 13 [Neofusicoccum parvum]
MTEPRMRMRQKGQQFDTRDLEAYLIAFGDDRNPLPETVRVLDEIITDFIIETCHEAALCASYSRRAKIKVDDFKFILRKDPVKLGRVTELLNKEKEIKSQRKVFAVDDEQIGKDETLREEAKKGKRKDERPKDERKDERVSKKAKSTKD